VNRFAALYGRGGDATARDPTPRTWPGQGQAGAPSRDFRSRRRPVGRRGPASDAPKPDARPRSRL